MVGRQEGGCYEASQGRTRDRAIDDGVEQHLTAVYFVGNSRQQPHTGILVSRLLHVHGHRAFELSLVADCGGCSHSMMLFVNH